MNLKEKIYQLIISRLDGGRICDPLYQENILTLARKGIGGFIIFGGTREDLKPFIDKLQAIAEIPLFIASDIERGVGQQIEGYTRFPCQMAVRAAINMDDTGDMAILRSGIRAVALEALDAGINMPLIPVLDVNNNPDNPIICTRAFSDNPEDVSFLGSKYISILEEMNLLSCAKHFPGHGSTSIDSHISLPLITKSYEELAQFDIRPFTEAIKTGVSIIMIGHLLIPSIDAPNPSSLSEKLITGILRKDLGFKGLIMTDALNMSAVSGIKNVAARCLNAGVDIILHPSDSEVTVMELENAVRTGVTSEETIDSAAGRILKAKSQLSENKQTEIDFHKHTLVSKHISGMSVTLVNKKEGVLPVADNENLLIIIAGEERLCELPLWATRFSDVHTLTKWEKNPVRHSVTHPSPGQEIQKHVRDDKDNCRAEGEGVDDVLSCETVIIAIFSEVAAWRGSAGIDDVVIKQINKLVSAAGTSIVISFGSPYILRHFSHADVRIAAYEANVCTQEAVINGLKDEACFNGWLPVRL